MKRERTPSSTVLSVVRSPERLSGAAQPPRAPSRDPRGLSAERSGLESFLAALPGILESRATARAAGGREIATRRSTFGDDAA